MALKVCNVCGSQGYTDECAACLGAGRGSVRDYHFAYEEGEASPEAAPSEPGDEGEAASEDIKIPDDDEYDPAEDDEFDREELEGHTRNRLSSIAAERGLDPSGTKDELVARLLGEDQG